VEGLESSIARRISTRRPCARAQIRLLLLLDRRLLGNGLLRRGRRAEGLGLGAHGFELGGGPQTGEVARQALFASERRHRIGGFVLARHGVLVVPDRVDQRRAAWSGALAHRQQLHPLERQAGLRRRRPGVLAVEALEVVIEAEVVERAVEIEQLGEVEIARAGEAVERELGVLGRRPIEREAAAVPDDAGDLALAQGSHDARGARATRMAGRIHRRGSMEKRAWLSAHIAFIASMLGSISSSLRA
jgi:hypothetical protein